ncbi:MAG: anthranilate phosphoribosyltransferase [Lachnospiraceae bacterium]|nr:anthranilate phosphoribosyltransferase [Lachnospiraceae bacterium]MBQ3165656.1 anthranilate phosphoribosyltransferase [Lachnospiraceae bacterium]MBQ6993510.1 anthranilate phosphoribosyltransferase [Lachnospiraceae bacterium]
MIQEATKKIIENRNLTEEEAEQVMNEIMTGQAAETNMAAFLTALRIKGETVEEISAFAKGMRAAGVKLKYDGDLLEIVGTGGDEANSINISTTASIVVAAAGFKVGKHGNRSVSSKSGAADCLEALGVKLDIAPEKNAKILNQSNICFMFAQKYHSAMRFVGPVRKALGYRTVFNILGPLANPAGANHELLGVYDEKLIEPMAQVLHKLGVERAMVVFGKDGLDEISLSSDTICVELKHGEFRRYEITPEQFGFKRCKKEELVGGNPTVNAEIAKKILKGEETGAKADAVLLNAGVGIYLMQEGITIADGIQIARNTIESGKAYAKLEEFIALTNEE